MRHFSCDLCGKDLSPGDDARFVVRMDVFPAATPPAPPAADDLDGDPFAAMDELLADELAAGDEGDAPDRRTLEYDLCPACHAKFVADPLGRESRRKLRFSKN